MAPFQGNLRGTTIGSLPLLDAREATDLIFKYAPLLPSWAQLPKNPGEGMLEQYNEGLPGIQQTEGKIYFETNDQSFEQELLRFYENYLGVTESNSQECLEHFAISPNRARGFFSFIRKLADEKSSPPEIVKGQITGPFTLSTGLKDCHGKFAFYNPQLRDVIVKHLSLKAKWQITQLHKHAGSVLMFIDEPSLAGFGSSAYVGVQAQDIHKDLQEVIGSIHQACAWAGVHCCENTDWSLLLKSGIDVLSFDAYGFFDRVFLYKEELIKFVSRGGTLAWGIVPTLSEELVNQISADSLIQLWKEEALQLAGAGISIEHITAQSLITPSCGAGTLSVSAAVRVLQLLYEVSQSLRKEFILA